MTQQEWLAAFKKENGREPSLDEFKAAKANGFALTTDQQERSERERLQAWVADFENKYGRKPSIDEVKKRQYAAPTSTAKSVTATNGEAPTAPHRQSRAVSKKHGFRLPIIIIVLALLAGYFYGQHYYSYDSSMNRAVKVLNSHNADQYSQNLTWSDTDKHLSKSEVVPLVKYMKTGMTKTRVESLLKNDSFNVNLKKTGNQFFIFPKYQMVVTPIDLQVYTNHSDLKVTANDQVIVDDSDEDEVATVKHQAPGNYDMVAQGESDGDSFKGTMTATVLNKAAAEIDLHAYKSSSSSSSKSKLTKTGADALLANLTSLLSQAGSSDSSFDTSDLTASDVFVNGSNNKAYSDFMEMIQNNKTTAKRTAESINFGSIDIQDVNATGKQTADVTFKIKEDFNYSADTDPDKHSSGTLSQVFLLKAHVKYDDDASKWLIDSIDSDQKKLSETDNVK
ncbi:hypothetical protein [Fructobacillus americanaquae]|uniref:Uncharacterized protein n=1 Tax=Fructobacillus americanaquae TaxID=2940302 RepID=A0ABY5C313_9LACO|nr:hypothetical protein [Fructobacillus americanaquae]USS92558.1 hypothetical protein M3M36_02820 [Fructobacillus americanaquae]